MRWKKIVLGAVLLFTLFNITPSIIYYSRDLAGDVSLVEEKDTIANRLATDETLTWVNAFCDLLEMDVVAQVDKDPSIIKLQFAKDSDIPLFKKMLAKASGNSGNPKISPLALSEDLEKNSLLLQREVVCSPALAQVTKMEGKLFADDYKKFVYEKAKGLKTALGRPTLMGYLARMFIYSQDINEQVAIVNELEMRLSDITGAFDDSASAKIIKNILSRGSKNSIVGRVKYKAERIVEDIDNKRIKGIFNRFINILGSACKSEDLPKPTHMRSKDCFDCDDPFIAKVAIDWAGKRIRLFMPPELKDLLESSVQVKTVVMGHLHSVLNNEDLIYEDGCFNINFDDNRSMLVVDLQTMSSSYKDLLADTIARLWHPTSNDLAELKKRIAVKSGFDELSAYLANKGSLYVVLPSAGRLYEEYSKENNDVALCFMKDISDLRHFLEARGFYQVSSCLMPGDMVFEKKEFFNDFVVKAKEQFCRTSPGALTLGFTDLEKRLHTLNKIEDAEHEALIMMRDNYEKGQRSLTLEERFVFPKPPKNVFLNNILLTLRKYFRGDKNRVLKWGLDLSGGKSVTVELTDSNGQVVTDKEGLEQGMDELRSRVSGMGLSEVTLRQEQSNIVIDFPSSKNLSAEELIIASKMSFHVVNEKFSFYSQLGRNVKNFLANIWHEAQIAGDTSEANVNKIASKYLYGEQGSAKVATPLSSDARILYDNGLRLGSAKASSVFDTTASKIVIKEGSSAVPLLIVFRNHALEGTNLSDVRPAYDPLKGNFLAFSVKSHDGKRDPRADFHTWTTKFCKGGSLSKDLAMSGCRMAIVLNNRVISAPVLESALKNDGIITGKFSKQDVLKLAANLKAGALSYTPKILAETNVSPELGKSDRTKGIGSVILALALVIAVMIYYYRFAGLIASIAVILNLVIICTVLQSMQATLSLAGIAGIILTLGMAVDANVLIFERIKEEMVNCINIQAAIKKGYDRAFSSIFDANFTTFLVGLIIWNFDNGPIRALSITLMIGIASSMFTALFMTRLFFEWYSKLKTLNMCDWIRGDKIAFKRWSTPVALFSGVLIIIGALLFTQEKTSVLGMDLNGGYALTIEADKEQITDAFVDGGLSQNDFQIRSIGDDSGLRIFLSLDAIDKIAKGQEQHSKVALVVALLKEHGIKMSRGQLDQIYSSWTTVGGQISKQAAFNAVCGIVIALLAITIYISLRFSLNYAFSAVVCLLHDVLVTCAILMIARKFGLPLQIDLHCITAIMTIIGYSLNDTIVVFDRIREEHLNNPRADIIDYSINKTFGRTCLTSITTLVGVLAIVILGGNSIFCLSFVLLVGFLFGTLSSLFIAAPLLSQPSQATKIKVVK